MLSIRCFLLTTIGLLLMHNANALDNQQKESSFSTKETTLQNKDFGISDFLKLTFNHPLYGRETLPTHLRDLQILLSQGRIVPNPVPYTKALFKLFGNKMKGSPYISAYALLELLEQLPTSLDYLTALKPLDVAPVHYYDDLHNLLYDAFLTKFDELKTNPDAFFNTLTNNVVSLVSQRLNKPAFEITKNETIEDVQPMLVRFIDTAISKLMWNTKEPANIWVTTKGIATELESLYDKEFIGDLSDLDDLYWSLIHRFSLFLDLAANNLPLELLHDMHNEVVSGNLVMLSIPEQEGYLDSKKKILEAALTSAISKRLSYEHGIFIAP